MEYCVAPDTMWAREHGTAQTAMLDAAGESPAATRARQGNTGTLLKLFAEAGELLL
jgi:hypothetical protein